VSDRKSKFLQGHLRTLVALTEGGRELFQGEKVGWVSFKAMKKKAPDREIGEREDNCGKVHLLLPTNHIVDHMEGDSTSLRKTGSVGRQKRPPPPSRTGRVLKKNATKKTIPLRLQVQKRKAAGSISDGRRTKMGKKEGFEGSVMEKRGRGAKVDLLQPSRKGRLKKNHLKREKLALKKN